MLPPLDSAGADPEEAALVEAVVDTIDRYASDHVDAGRIDREGHVPPAVLRDLADLGLFGISIPTDYGGAGLSLHGVCSVVEGLARHDRSVATTVGLHVGLGTRGMVAFGPDAVRERYLPDLATGRRLAAFAATEPGAGSDLKRIATRAVAIEEGVQVDGTKIYVTNGALAEVYTLLVASPGLGGVRRGHSLVVVEREDAGVAIGPEEHKLGLRGSSTTSLDLDGVRVGTDRVIGRPGHGMSHAHHVLAWGRTAMAAGCTGAARAALDATLSHVCQREQFGRPLGQLDVVRDQVASMAALHFAMGALVRWTGAAEGELERRSAAAKVLCSEGDWEICDLAVQLHGGAGFIEETGLPLLLRDARITRIFEGANDVLLTRLGSLEVASPGPRPPWPDGAEPSLVKLAAAFRARVEAVRVAALEEHGARIALQPRVLHRLGQHVVLREALDAAVVCALDAGSPLAHELAVHWAFLAGRRAPPAGMGAEPDAVHDLTETLYRETRP